MSRILLLLAHRENRRLLADWLASRYQVLLPGAEQALAADEFAGVQKANVNDPKQAEAYGIQARNLKRLSDQGTRIVLGTDGNTPWAPHQEMEAMAMAGMMPMQVIVASTGRAAEFLRITDAGTLQTGKSADLIVLDANPLENITNTRRINAVYQRGQMVNRSAYPN